MPALSYGLNVPKKAPSLANRPPPAKRRTVFDNVDDEEETEDGPTEEAISTLGGLGSASPAPTSPEPPRSSKMSLNPNTTRKNPPPSTSQYGDLSTNHTTALHANTAQSLDPSIYDYDAVYESLHATSGKSSAQAPAGPKYMGNLLAAAEVRKRDQLRAKEKMLAKEREAEGDEFADKEKFVTGAYKAQQEEVRRLEEEEVRQEADELERRRKTGGGMVGLYRGMLDRDEKRHEEVVKAVEEGHGVATKEGDRRWKSEAELAREKGAVMNDDGVVVDKRQLLNAGLNVAAKPKDLASSTGADDARRGVEGGMSARLQGRGGAKQATRERQSRMLEAQLEEASKRAAGDDEVQREALERASKSRKTEGDISSAKERYLQRKKEAAAAAVMATAN
ncbi:hypothetical protein MMC13_006854 [Lambiella insularis]|nr:hypothetical protein [Lambiella insularis]